MRIHRFFIKKPEDLEKFKTAKTGGLISLFDADLIHQWKNVFRYTAGAQLELFDGVSGVYHVVIHKIWGISADVEVLKVESVTSIEMSDKKVNKKEIWLLCSILKGDNFDLVVQKATELGVSAIVPLLTERTIKKAVNKERLEKIVIEAVEQSGRVLVPRVFEPQTFEKAFELVGGAKIVVCQQGTAESASDISKKFTDADTIALVIGPEGGWSPAELEMFSEKQFATLSMGESVLRAETAAIVSVGLVSLL